jgi:anti-anti-sigma factor
MIEMEEREDRVVLRPDFDLVAGKVSEIREAVLRVARRGRKVVLVLGEGLMIDSWGIGVVVGCQKTVQDLGGALTVETSNPSVIDLFELLNLESIITPIRPAAGK